jgi:hypothetical protein
MIRFHVRRRSKTPAQYGGGFGPIVTDLDGGFATTTSYPRTVDNGFANTTSFPVVFNGGGA